MSNILNMKLNYSTAGGNVFRRLASVTQIPTGDIVYRQFCGNHPFLKSFACDYTRETTMIPWYIGRNYIRNGPYYHGTIGQCLPRESSVTFVRNTSKKDHVHMRTLDEVLYGMILVSFKCVMCIMTAEQCIHMSSNKHKKLLLCLVVTHKQVKFLFIMQYTYTGLSALEEL